MALRLLEYDCPGCGLKHAFPLRVDPPNDSIRVFGVRADSNGMTLLPEGFEMVHQFGDQEGDETTCRYCTHHLSGLSAPFLAEEKVVGFRS